jgi:citrate lyase subunit beta/citryl-CoA lyase
MVRRHCTKNQNKIKGVFQDQNHRQNVWLFCCWFDKLIAGILTNRGKSSMESVVVGRDEKSDVKICFSATTSTVWDLHLTSSVQELFGRHLHEFILQSLTDLKIAPGRIDVQDRGALDFVIQARLHALGQLLGNPPVPIAAKTIRSPQRQRLRRTRLYLPGNNPDLMINAGLFGSDCLILDLEDSVAPQEKAAARHLVRHALAALEWGGSEVIVRINSLRTPFGQQDLEMIVPLAPDAILIPKCESRQDVLDVESTVAELERKAGLDIKIQFMPLIESSLGVWQSLEIAQASTRNVALCFGAEDFTADIGAERTVEGKESFVGRSMVLLAARAAGLQALDTVFSNVQDEQGLLQSTREAIALGFEGKGVIHPGQIKPIHQVFCPTAEQIARAQGIVAAMEEARAKGSGVIAVGSKMIDAPVVLRAERTLAMAKAYGLIK